LTWPPTKNFRPFSWQTVAAAVWDHSGRKGVVEAVTGTGKTHVGLETIDNLIRTERRLSTLIVVPTILLCYANLL